jgi:GNAT superfamily N-acetyltransferase
MPTEITIHEAIPSDWRIIADNNIAMAAESESKTLPREVVEAGVRAALADSDKGRYFLAQVDGRTVGQLLVTREWSDWRNGWFWWIQSVYVVPEHRRRGVYRQLHEHVRGLAHEAKDICGIRLYVERNNHRAIETYHAMGMTDAGYALFEEDWSHG